MTQELFEAVMGENPSKFQGESYPHEDGETQKFRPVETISWYHAIVFYNRLSILMGLEPCYTIIEQNGGEVPYESIALSAINQDCSTWQSVSCDLSKNGFRLPTAAEWEFAARGGDQSASTDWNYTYAGTSDINALSDVAWYNNDLDASTKKTHEVGKLKPNRLGLYDMSGNCWEFCSDRSESIPLGVVTDPIAENASGECIRISGSFSDSSTWAHVYSSYTNSVTDTYSNNGIRLARSGFPRAN